MKSFRLFVWQTVKVAEAFVLYGWCRATGRPALAQKLYDLCLDQAGI